MEDYPTVGAEIKNRVAVNHPSSRRSLASRLDLTWWRNPNARGIAEPDPRTVAPGRRPRRALSSPCPWSRRRVKRERQLQGALPQVGPLLTRLTALANIWPDRELVIALMRALTDAEAERAWILTDPAWAGRTYERATSLYLPRLSDADATRFLRAVRAARRFLDFAERTLARDAHDRLRSLVASLRPSRPPVDLTITRRPDERRDIDPHDQPPATAQGWKEVADRIAARILAERPRDAM